MGILLGRRETLVRRQRALVGASALEVLGDVAWDGGGDRGWYGLGEWLAGNDALDGGGAEGAVTGGVAERFADAGHSDSLGDLEEAVHVVAGGAAAPLAQPLEEGRRRIAQAQELGLEDVAAGT
jgi:hypothetical protein